MAKDYYNILGVGKSASQDEIKKAFRKLAHQHHPDKEGGDVEKFKEINEAYQILSDEQKRKAYDQFGEAGVNGQGGFSGAGGFSWSDFARQAGFGDGNFQGGANFDLGDIFSDFFGGGARQGGARRRQARGADIHMDVDITFEEAAFGVKKNIELYKATTCSTCNGNGAKPGTPIKTCERCHGQGAVDHVQRTVLGMVHTQTQCPECHGEGKTAETTCETCRGTGSEKRNVKIEASIPAGIGDQQTLRLNNQGEAGERGATPGDLYVTLRVGKPKYNWIRQEDDILAPVELPFTTLVFGGKIAVPTLDGEFVVKVPAGTEAGKVLRLKGKGFSHLQSTGRGDHLVEVRVKVPKHLGGKEKRLLKDLHKLYTGEVAEE
ncbi:MAG: molecular chaperone DnaJ [Candidatus Kerfeldbacteria bacterium]|nr:molecular chaperone DnaJ [Candidatus Kerfeldbacteria bacterium]